ncbi:MAG: cobalt transporter CbiM [Desulfovibrionaceae bacterium]
MHISEGVLSWPVLASGWALTVAGVGLGLRRMDHERVMAVGLLSAAFFVASLIHVPIGLASVHLVLNGLLGLLLGWAAVPAILAGLALQALLFQYGGLTVLGVNTLNMALPAVLCHYAFRGLVRRPGWARLVGAFGAGAAGIALAGTLTAASLALADEGFAAAAAAILLAHAPVMVVEGLVTAGAVSFLAKVQPEMLQLDLGPGS